MSASRFARLEARGVVAVTGPDAEPLLQGLVTNDMARLDATPALHAGLLTPQGKIMFAFFIVRAPDGVLLETAASSAAELAKRLAFYRLRAKADIADVSDTYSVFAAWPEPGPFPAGALGYRDPRHADLGNRVLVATAAAAGFAADWRTAGLVAATAEDYRAHRIACGVAEFGSDFAGAEVFPHEANFDRQDGVDFRKGCFVGQEVVSRMQHKTVVRKRFVAVEGTDSLPAGQAEIVAGPATLGRLGDVEGRHGLALVRLDRALEMREAGTPALAGGVAVTIAPDALEDYARDAARRAADTQP